MRDIDELVKRLECDALDEEGRARLAEIIRESAKPVPPMKTYEVALLGSEGKRVRVTACEVQLAMGCLLFRDKKGHLCGGYAQGEWKAFAEECFNDIDAAKPEK
jgi:hypothetical protein